MFPVASKARTRNWCTPTPRSVYGIGERHVLKEPPSSEHWNVEPSSVDENAKLALVLAVSAGGPDNGSIVVSGAVVSGGAWTAHVWTAADSSTRLAVSLATTRNSCGPTAS